MSGAVSAAGSPMEGGLVNEDRAMGSGQGAVVLGQFGKDSPELPAGESGLGSLQWMHMPPTCAHACTHMVHAHVHATRMQMCAHAHTEEENVEEQESAQMITSWTWVQSLREKNLSGLLGSGGKSPLRGSSAPALSSRTA